MESVIFKIFIFAVFGITDLVIVLISGFAYGKKNRYQEGMLFGVHIPEEALEDETVRILTERFTKGWRILQISGLLFGTGVCFLSFAGFTAFFISWCIWFCAYMAGLCCLVYHTHRKMYRIKIERGWVSESSARIVRIDTGVSSAADRMPVSWKWHLPSLILLIVTGVLTLRRVTGSDADAGAAEGFFSGDGFEYIVIFFVGLIEILSFLAFHIWIGRRPNIVYSQNSKINFALNMMTKRAWTKGLVLAALIAAAASAYLVIRLAMGKWVSDFDIFLYIFCQMMSAAALLVPVVLIRRKRQDLILSDKEQFLIDDDEYWKNGWYSNPDDPHLFVTDRMSDMNFAMNMARPAAKAICIATAAITIAALVFAAAVYLHFSTAEVSFVRDEDIIEVSAAGYKCEFSLQEVKSAELLYEMPEDKFRRTNGASTDEYNIGHFRGKEIGKCMMFLYNGYEPILKIRLEDKTVFVNSRQSEQTESWLALLGRKQS